MDALSRFPSKHGPIMALALGALGALHGCGSNVGAGAQGGADAGGLDRDGTVTDSAGGVDRDGAVTDSASGASESGDGNDGLLPRCIYVDGSSRAQCTGGLICVLNGSCDPPAPPNCGQVCVDCANPPPGLSGPNGPCAQQCAPACGATEVCVGSQTFESYPGDGGAADCPAGTVPSGPYCESAPVFACAAAPAACGGALDCTCAASLCAASYQCGSFTPRQINCVGLP
jgi:hypothetical protein